MTGSLDGHGLTPELRQLVVRAVAKLSDECEAPDLTPECPFMEFTADGAPACAEQCQDLIAEYPGDLLEGAIGLGAGLAVRPRRPRRGPDDATPPYDARQQLLEDTSRPIAEWRVGPLLSAARHLAYAPMRVADGVTSEQVVVELQRRGLDSPGLRTALARDRAVSLNFIFLLQTRPTIGSVTLAGATEDEPSEVSTAAIIADMTADPESWEEALGAVGGLAPADEGPRINVIGMNAIVGWLSTKPMEQLICDVVPTAADLEAGLEITHDIDALHDGRWILERFTTTFVSDWSTSSLEREWAFIKARRPGCVPSGLMRQRAIDPHVVSAALADHHLTAAESTDEDEDTAREASWTPSHFMSLAVDKLTEGKTESAASVFKVLYELNESDPENLNNLGFCLLPTAPEEALHYLELCIELGPPAPEITFLNAALALHLIGRNQEAMESASHAVSTCKRDERGFMWKFGHSGLIFDHVNDLAQYGNKLLDHFAECNGKCLPGGPTLVDAGVVSG